MEELGAFRDKWGFTLPLRTLVKFAHDAGIRMPKGKTVTWRSWVGLCHDFMDAASADTPSRSSDGDLPHPSGDGQPAGSPPVDWDAIAAGYDVVFGANMAHKLPTAPAVSS